MQSAYGESYSPELLNDFREKIPNSYVILYRAVTNEEIPRIALEGITLGVPTLNEHHEALALIFEQERVSVGIEGFSRNAVIYAELTPQGMMTSRSRGPILDVAIHPDNALVGNAELYSEASMALYSHRSDHEVVRSIAQEYWTSCFPLNQLSERMENTDFSRMEDVLEVLIKEPIPVKYIRLHTN